MQFGPGRSPLFDRLARGAGGEPPGVLKKIAAVVVTLTLFALALMFSVVLFAVVLTAGTVVWGYLWWKTRGLRKQMRDRPRGGGIIIEGESIREVHPDRHDGGQR